MNAPRITIPGIDRLLKHEAAQALLAAYGHTMVVDALRATVAGYRDALLAGGDWKICYSQDETDAVVPCHPVQELAFSGTCPPQALPNRRLGSGTGERLTFGPATMWKMAAHIKVPRYPWRLNDGSLVKSVADGAFWSILAHLGAPLARLPLVIGNYHFHPQEQAEYRHPEELGKILPNILKI
jgi:hypothetical protein